MNPTRSIVFAAMLLGGCAATPQGQESVTPEMWAEAQQHAVRLSGGSLSTEGKPPIGIVNLPIEQLCKVAGRCPHAAAQGKGFAFFRDDRPWQTDRGHHFGIVIHEAVHSLQDRSTTSQGCREYQAHEIQIAWLNEQGEPKRAADVARNMHQYRCEGTS